jgi:hypothetical protein
MAILTSALDTDFTPAVGYFAVQAVNRDAQLWRKTSAAADFVLVGTVPFGTGIDVYQASNLSVWRFRAAPGTIVQASET